MAGYNAKVAPLSLVRTVTRSFLKLSSFEAVLVYKMLEIYIKMLHIDCIDGSVLGVLYTAIPSLAVIYYFYNVWRKKSYSHGRSWKMLRNIPLRDGNSLAYFKSYYDH